MTYSLDFRQKVMDYKTKKGLTFEQTSPHFDIGIRTLFRWSTSLSPCNKRQKPATKMDMDALKHDVENSPDAYQWERALRFGVHQSTIYYALKRLEISYKKNTTTSKSQRRGSQEI